MVPKLLLPVVNSTLIFYTMITAVLMGNRNSKHLIIRAAWHHDSGSYLTELEICPFLLHFDALSAPCLQIFWKYLNMKAKMRPQKYTVPDPMLCMDQNLWKWTIGSLFKLYISDYCSATAFSDQHIRKQLTGSHSDKVKRNAEIKFGFKLSFIHTIPGTTLSNMGGLTSFPFTHNLIFWN